MSAEDIQAPRPEMEKSYVEALSCRELPEGIRRRKTSEKQFSVPAASRAGIAISDE